MPMEAIHHIEAQKMFSEKGMNWLTNFFNKRTNNRLQAKNYSSYLQKQKGAKVYYNCHSIKLMSHVIKLVKMDNNFQEQT